MPLYGQTVENVAENWLQVLHLSDCGIPENSILLLNNPQDWQTFFDARHSMPANALEKTHQLDTWSILTDTIVPPSKFQKFLDSAHALLQDSDIEYLLFGHLGDCHLHFHFIPTREQQPKALEIYQKIIQQSAAMGGIYSAEHGTGKRKRTDFIECFGNEGVKQVQISKAALDPDFLLNRGNVIAS
jgi:D-lactate dehydrogenase (cytochrome)